MKKILIVLFLTLTTSSVFAQAGERGLGVMLGNPTGIAGKYWLNEDQAVDGGFGISLGKHTDVSLHSDFLLHNKGAFVLNDVHPLDLYYGIGGRMEFADSIELGLRVPVGLAHRLSEEAADVFAEVAPIFDFVPSTGIELHIAVGARYYFK